MSSNGYEVYEVYIDDTLVYVGSGAKGRHKHANSGTSHVYELNKAHFDALNGNGSGVTTKVVARFNTKQESVDHEKTLIRTKLPKFNVVANPARLKPMNLDKAEFSIQFMSFFLGKLGYSINYSKHYNEKIWYRSKEALKLIADSWIDNEGVAYICNTGGDLQNIRFMIYENLWLNSRHTKLLSQYFNLERKYEKKFIAEITIKDEYVFEFVSGLSDNIKSRYKWLEKWDVVK